MLATTQSIPYNHLVFVCHNHMDIYESLEVVPPPNKVAHNISNHFLLYHNHILFYNLQVFLHYKKNYQKNHQKEKIFCIFFLNLLLLYYLGFLFLLFFYRYWVEKINLHNLILFILFNYWIIFILNLKLTIFSIN